MEFNFGTIAQQTKAQISKLQVGESRALIPTGRDSFALGPVVQSIGKSLGRKYSLKTDKLTGQITVTRVSITNPPLNYSQYLQLQIEHMGVGVSKVLGTKGEATFKCSPFIAALGRKLGKKFKLKTDKRTGKVWVGRVN